MILSQLFLSTVLVVLPTVYSYVTDLEAQALQLDRYQKELQTKSNLGYGDRCRSEEVKTMEIMNKSWNKISELPIISSYSLLVAEYEKMNQALKHLLSKGYDVCNDEKLLACDRTTHRCDCGVTDLVLNQNFSFVRNSNGDCRFAKDSSCLPVYENPGKPDICAGDTSCILTNKRGEIMDCDGPNYNNGFSVGDKVKFPHCQCKRT